MRSRSISPSLRRCSKCAIVSATDVRPAAKEEIKSLGGTFVGVEDEETAAQKGAYAKEMSDAFRQKQAELMATTVAKNESRDASAVGSWSISSNSGRQAAGKSRMARFAL